MSGNIQRLRQQWILLFPDIDFDARRRQIRDETYTRSIRNRSVITRTQQLINDEMERRRDFLRRYYNITGLNDFMEITNKDI